MSINLNKKYYIGDKVPETGLYTRHNISNDSVVDVKRYHKYTDNNLNIFPSNPDTKMGDCYYIWNSRNPSVESAGEHWNIIQANNTKIRNKNSEKLGKIVVATVIIVFLLVALIAVRAQNNQNNNFSPNIGDSQSSQTTSPSLSPSNATQGSQNTQTTTTVDNSNNIACMSVNAWPNDFGILWPKAIAAHNADPNNVTAASYMQSYINTLEIASNSTDPNVIGLFGKYKNYWSLLERDYLANNGSAPNDSNSPSTLYLASLMESCKNYNQ